MGTAKQSKKRLADLKRGTPYRDPDTGKVVVRPDKKEESLDLFDPEAYDSPADKAKRAREKKRKK